MLKVSKKETFSFWKLITITMTNVGYRTGKLLNHKSDYICQFTGGSRSTGYFGTGYYFCVKPSHCITTTRKDDPLLKLTFKKDLKWFVGTVKRHDILKQITSFVACYKNVCDPEKVTDLYWMVRRLHENFYLDKATDIIDKLKADYEYDLENEFCTDFESFLNIFENRYYQRFIEAVSRIDSLNPLADLIYKEDYEAAKDFIASNGYLFDYDAVDSLRNLSKGVPFKVYLEFNIDEKEFLNWAAGAYEYYKEHGYDQMDSISTKFLKYLGYDGVWPSEECDNTIYGGVVFERENIEEVRVLANVAKDWNGLDESRRVVEGRDYIYKAKVDSKWLKGRELVNNKKDADTFESETEPTQRINQLKKKHKIRKGAKVKLIRMKEACMENTFGWHLSPYSFSEPRINHKAGFGTSFYGAGFYITLDESTIETMISEAQDMFAEYFIYKVQVDENANIVDEYEADGLQLYADLVEQFDGDEIKASKEMVARGIDGILYYNEEDGHSIVFYNPSMIKIVNTQYKKGFGERSELQESNVYDDYLRRVADQKVSKKDKWNLKMNIDSLKKEIIELQNTTADLPDDYVREVCNLDAYPFEDVIDEDQELTTWCSEVDDFLNDSLDL